MLDHQVEPVLPVQGQLGAGVDPGQLVADVPDQGAADVRADAVNDDCRGPDVDGDPAGAQEGGLADPGDPGERGDELRGHRVVVEGPEVVEAGVGILDLAVPSQGRLWCSGLAGQVAIRVECVRRRHIAGPVRKKPGRAVLVVMVVRCPLRGQVRDRVLLRVGQPGADERVDGMEPGGAVLLDAGPDPVRGPFADGAVGLQRSRDGADAFAVEVDVGRHQRRGALTGLLVRAQLGGVGAEPGGLVQLAGGHGLQLEVRHGSPIRAVQPLMCAETPAALTAYRAGAVSPSAACPWPSPSLRAGPDPWQ